MIEDAAEHHDILASIYGRRDTILDYPCWWVLKRMGSHRDRDGLSGKTQRIYQDRIAAQYRSARR